MVEEPREDFFQARINSLLILVRFGPGLKCRGCGAAVPCRAGLVPAAVDFIAHHIPNSAPHFDANSWVRLEGCVRRTEGQVGKEGSACAHLLLVRI